MNRSKMESRNMQISNHQYFGKDFQTLQKKLGTNENSSKFGIEAIETHVLMWRLFMKQPFTLDRIALSMWMYTRTRSSRTSRVYSVYSDSVRCLGKLSDPSERNQRRDGQAADHQRSPFWPKKEPKGHSDFLKTKGYKASRPPCMRGRRLNFNKKVKNVAFSAFLSF